MYLGSPMPLLKWQYINGSANNSSSLMSCEVGGKVGVIRVGGVKEGGFWGEVNSIQNNDYNSNTNYNSIYNNY